MNVEPELSTAWTRRRAIKNYEKFQNSVLSAELDGETSIETIAKTSLGVEGWALHDFGDNILFHGYGDSDDLRDNAHDRMIETEENRHKTKSMECGCGSPCPPGQTHPHDGSWSSKS